MPALRRLFALVALLLSLADERVVDAAPPPRIRTGEWASAARTGVQRLALGALRGHLRCILLVSHQEEFAEAFPNGYRFELQNGATKVSRFQR